MKKNTLFFGIFVIIILSCHKDSMDYSNILSTNAWKINSYRIGNPVAYSFTTEDYIFNFNGEKKTYELNLDVNDCSGSFIISDKISIELESPGCSEICCDSDFAEELLRVIPIITNYQIRGNLLWLVGDGVTIILEKY